MMTERTTAPRRIQRSRGKGWRMPAGAIYVGRPSRWGNPFDWRKCSPDAGTPAWARGVAVDLFREWITSPWRHTEKAAPPDLADILLVLQGHDLACWCPLGHVCHADVLLELANR